MSATRSSTDSASQEVMDPPTFIRIWQTCETLAEVVARTGMAKEVCRVRAWRYRRLGVPLKQLKTPPLLVWNWSYLAQLAEDVLDEHEAATEELPGENGAGTDSPVFAKEDGSPVTDREMAV